MLPAEPIYEPGEIRDIVEFVESFGQPGPDIPDPDPELGDLALGAELYQLHCAACHSTTGIGGALASGRAPAPGEQEITEVPELIAPPLNGTTAKDIAEAMITGPGTMPAFGQERFSDQEIDSIVRYVLYLQDPLNPGGAEIGRIGPVAEGAVGWIVGLGLLLLFAAWIGTRGGERR